MIDRVREQIQQRLDQIAGEVDRLREALAELDPRSSDAPALKRQRTRATKSTAGTAKRASTRRTRTPATRSPRRDEAGATKAAVIAALAGDEAMTASEVATKAGLARPTVSTTLSRLAKSGEVEKAERGYRLASAAPSSPAA